MGRVVQAGPACGDARVILSPGVSGPAPAMAGGGDVSDGLLPRVKGGIIEAGGVGGGAPGGAGGGLRDLGGGLDGLGLHMGRVVQAGSAGGDARVVLRPGIGRLSPMMAQHFDGLLGGQHRFTDGAMAALGQARLGTGRRHGGVDDRGVRLVQLAVGLEEAALAVDGVPAGETVLQPAVDVEPIAIAVQQRFSGDKRAAVVKIVEAVGELVEAGGGVALRGEGQRGIGIDVQRLAAVASPALLRAVASYDVVADRDVAGAAAEKQVAPVFANPVGQVAVRVVPIAVHGGHVHQVVLPVVHAHQVPGVLRAADVSGNQATVDVAVELCQLAQVLIGLGVALADHVRAAVVVEDRDQLPGVLDLGIGVLPFGGGGLVVIAHQPADRRHVAGQPGIIRAAGVLLHDGLGVLSGELRSVDASGIHGIGIALVPGKHRESKADAGTVRHIKLPVAELGTVAIHHRGLYGPDGIVVAIQPVQLVGTVKPQGVGYVAQRVGVQCLPRGGDTGHFVVGHRVGQHLAGQGLAGDAGQAQQC